MPDLIASARRAFWKSPHHAVMAVATLGAGFATGEPLYFLAGLTAYVLGWVYLPDMAFFQKWRERRMNAETNAATATELAQFTKRREALLASLSSPLRERYALLAKVCRDIERAAAENEYTAEVSLSGDARLRKIDELMWMYLRLLSMEQSLEMFLETERSEDLRGSMAEAEQETVALEAEIKAEPALSGTKERLLGSRRERLEVLRKRWQRVEEAESNLELVLSEQKRLAEQVKLIRADAVATRNADALSARIDASVAHLNETNRWLSEMDQFRDLAGDLPMVDARIGFETATQRSALPPSTPEITRPKKRAVERQG
ncbi:MAG: hypothetical protein M3Q89_08415 [Verrucomicrobiota bacterium]|nr:hypothetical protein [Verrucomicrobiota bacterium]